MGVVEEGGGFVAGGSKFGIDLQSPSFYTPFPQVRSVARGMPRSFAMLARGGKNYLNPMRLVVLCNSIFFSFFNMRFVTAQLMKTGLLNRFSVAVQQLHQQSNCSGYRRIANTTDCPGRVSSDGTPLRQAEGELFIP